MEDKIPIYTIVVHPKNQYYAQYVINESSPHTKKYEALSEYLGSLIPEKILVINDLIDRRRHFLCLVQEKEVKELVFDLEKEFQELRNKTRADDFKKAHNGIQEKKSISEIFDNSIKSISNKNI